MRCRISNANSARRHDRAALGQVFQGVNGFHQTAEPTLGRFGLPSSIADVPYVLLSVEERGLGDINVEWQASPAIPLAPCARV